MRWFRRVELSAVMGICSSVNRDTSPVKKVAADALATKEKKADTTTLTGPVLARADTPGSPRDITMEVLDNAAQDMQVPAADAQAAAPTEPPAAATAGAADTMK